MSVPGTTRHSRRIIALACGFLVVAVVLLLARQPEPSVLAGPASVIDGDTLRVAGQKVRLQGVAAPELHETGGRAAKNAMIRLVKGRQVSCELDGTKSHDRVVGICYAAGRDVAAELVMLGLARDCARFSDSRYEKFETPAAQSLPLPQYCSP